VFFQLIWCKSKG
jgi:hypothetical protein